MTTARPPAALLAMVLAAALLLSGLVTSPADAQTPAAQGFPTVGSGHRPGPDALYLPPAQAPQLREHRCRGGPSRSLISGTVAYRSGEWLYQDFLFDDHGATGVIDRNEPYGTASNLYSPRGGTFTYPLDERYRHNAADLVELRITALDDATALRVTLNTMVDPELVAVTIALGDAGEHALAARRRRLLPRRGVPHRPRHHRRADRRRHRRGDDRRRPSPSTWSGDSSTSASLTAAWDPGRDTVPVTAGVGLWDVEGGTYLAPQPGFADDRHARRRHPGADQRAGQRRAASRGAHPAAGRA